MQYIFSRTNFYPKMQKSNWAVKRMGESARLAGLTIRLVVKAKSMSAKINCK